MESWKNWFTFAWPSGMYDKIHEANADVNLYIFNSSANWSSDEAYTTGEYNIFNLPRFEDFDGVLLDLNNTENDEVRQNLLDRVKASGVPAIAIGNRYEDFYSVGVHNYDAMTHVMRHMYNHHRCRRFWFILGPQEHYENKRRDDAIRDYIAKKYMPETDVAFFYGDFTTESGKKGFTELMEQSGTLPDAVICANDNIAVGALSAAEKLGFSAPRDFLISGFDDLDKSRFYSPRISTISYVREEIGYTAMEMFLDIWAGKDVPQHVRTKWNPIFWESCGCSNPLDIDLRAHLKGTILYNEENAVFSENIMLFNDKLTYCKNIQEMMAAIPECIPRLRCDGMYFVADPHLVNMEEQVEIGQDMSLDFITDPFVTNGYPEDMEVVFGYDMQRGGQDSLTGTVVNGIFPAFDTEEAGVNYLFLPLHFRDKCVGYMVIKNAIYLMDRQLLFDIVQTLTKNLEQLYQRGCIMKLNHVLTNIYNRDAMTMLYNRIGLQHVAEKVVESYHKRGKRMAITYFDLDGLKHLNDTYGHGMGDFAIKKVAEIIQKNADKNKLVFRMGGDEFLSINQVDTEEEEAARCAKIQQELHDAGVAENSPEDLVVSFGYILTDPAKDRYLGDYVLDADEIMYNYKISRRP